MPAIKTVIFDLGGVYFTEGVRQFVIRMHDAYGLPEAKLRDIVDGHTGVQYRVGDITPAQFWEIAMTYWNIDAADTAKVTQMWLDGYTPIPGTSVLIEKLQKAGYELLFLSDNAPDRVEYLDSKYKFLRKFKTGVFSHLARVRKPAVKIYTEALKLTASAPQECVYIDDKPKLLEPAKHLGVKTIAFQSPEQLEHDLQALQLKF